MTLTEAEALAARVLAAIDAAWRQDDYRAADRERVASDLAGLRQHQGDGYSCMHEDAAHCPDATRYADNLRRTARLYGQFSPSAQATSAP